MADISQIKLPNGDTYNLVDETSGYTSNVGTITKIKTTAGTHNTIDISSGAATFNVPTTAAHVGINFGYTTSGNNRAVLQDSNGNLYVTQKDDNSNTFKSFYGTCDTVAATAEKVITLSVTTGWQLVAGTVVGVKFTNTNTAQNPTLNINSTGAKSIYVNNAVLTTSNLWYAGEAGQVHFYMYDGTYWVFMGHSYDWNSDTKVTLTALTPPASGTSYVPTFHTATSGTTGLNATNNYYLRVMNGTTSANGYVYMCAGNATASGTAGNMIGGITLYGTGSYYTDIKSGSPTANRVITLPDKTGTVALTSDLSSYLPLAGGNVTGPVSFGDSISIDEATIGDLVVNGSGSFTNNLQVNTINGVAVGSSPKFTDTDAKVTQSATTTTSWRKVLVHYTTNDSGADVPASVTNQVYAAKGIEVQPSTGTLHADALTTKKITPLITGGSQTAAVTTSPYKPALWKFNAGITPANGNIVVIQTPGGGHSYGEFLSLDNGTTYKPITHSGTGKMTTHYANGSPVALVYDSDWTATSMYPLAGGTSTGTIEGGAWRVINGYLDGNSRKSFYGTCSTAAATAAKVISLSTTSGWELAAGTIITVKFTNTNTAQNPTFNVNGSGAKSVWYNTAIITTNALEKGGYATRPQMYVYDGTYWIWMGTSAENLAYFESESFNHPDGTGVWYVSGVSDASPTGSEVWGLLFQMRSSYATHAATKDAVYAQIFIRTDGVVYSRAFNNAWSSWRVL